MTDKVHIAAFGGSLRRDSLNRHLLNAVVILAPSDMQVEVLEIDDIPLYNQDLDPGMGGSDPPACVLRFGEGLRAAEGLVLVSPEYNWGIPGFVKNAVDWVSHPPRDSVMVGRPTLLMGASTGPAGTGRAQMAWRQTLLSMRTPVMVDALQVPLAHTRIARDGTLDQVLEDQIGELLVKLAHETREARDSDLRSRLRQPSAAPVAGVYPLENASSSAP